MMGAALGMTETPDTAEAREGTLDLLEVELGPGEAE